LLLSTSETYFELSMDLCRYIARRSGAVVLSTENLTLLVLARLVVE